MHPLARPSPIPGTTRVNQSLPDPDRHAEFYADVPLKRGIAWLVDMLLIGLLTAVVVPFTGFLALLFIGGLFLVVNFLYRWVTLARGSATPGMRLVAIELRDVQGQDLGTTLAFAHTLGYSLSMAFVFPQLISVALMLLSNRKQGLTDLVLGTVAINRAART